MVAAHLLHKLRVSDSITMRLLVKTANALAALEPLRKSLDLLRATEVQVAAQVRRAFQPALRASHRGTELAHPACFQLELQELDEEMCCLVSPVFLVNYMSDSLRRSFLKRCAEIQVRRAFGSFESCARRASPVDVPSETWRVWNWPYARSQQEPANAFGNRE